VKKILLILASAFAISACSTGTRYYWGDYSDASGQYSIDNDATKYGKALKQIIDDKPRRRIVAPGIYAEYGLLHLRLGMKETARYYFQLEKKFRPEFAQTMDYLIRETY